jgi:hypothetical protein
MEPLRTPAQFAHPQFHCGKPPPAADPRTRTCKARVPQRSVTTAAGLATRTFWRFPRSDPVEIVLVGTNLGAHVDLDEGRGNPAHR